MPQLWGGNFLNISDTYQDFRIIGVVFARATHCLPVIFFRQSLIKDVTFLPIISKRILDTSGHQGRPRADRGIYTLFQLVLGRYNSWDEGLKIFRHVLLNTLQSNIIYFTFGPWMATYSLKTFRLFFVWFQNYFS